VVGFVWLLVLAWASAVAVPGLLLVFCCVFSSLFFALFRDSLSFAFGFGLGCCLLIWLGLLLLMWLGLVLVLWLFLVCPRLLLCVLELVLRSASRRCVTRSFLALAVAVVDLSFRFGAGAGWPRARSSLCFASLRDSLFLCLGVGVGCCWCSLCCSRALVVAVVVARSSLSCASLRDSLLLGVVFWF